MLAFLSVGRRARENEGIVGVFTTLDAASRSSSKENERTLSGPFRSKRIYFGTTAATHSNPAAFNGICS